jgi:hypothetical protein
MGTALELEAKGVQEFQDLPAVRPQRWLVFAPGLGVRQRLIDAASAAGRPLDDAPVDEEQEDRGPLVQGRPRPEVGAAQVVLEVEPGVSGGLLEQGEAMLVVAMGGIVGQAAGPITGQLIDE